MNPKEISLHFLLEMNENFDDDLLQDVVEMIDYSKWMKIKISYLYGLFFIHCFVAFLHYKRKYTWNEYKMNELISYLIGILCIFYRFI